MYTPEIQRIIALMGAGSGGVPDASQVCMCTCSSQYVKLGAHCARTSTDTSAPSCCSTHADESWLRMMYRSGGGRESERGQGWQRCTPGGFIHANAANEVDSALSAIAINVQYRFGIGTAVWCCVGGSTWGHLRSNGRSSKARNTWAGQSWAISVVLVSARWHWRLCWMNHMLKVSSIFRTDSH